MIEYLAGLEGEGWKIAFVTGRTFHRGQLTLKDVKFPYHYAVYNGSLILEMPERRVISRSYLDRSVIPALDQLFEAEPFDFILYGGYEDEDRTYYRSSRFEGAHLDYVRRRAKTFQETFIDVESFSDVPVSEYASIKCFVEREEATRLSTFFEKELGLYSPMIRDPFQWDCFAVQATHPKSHKAAALQILLDTFGDLPTIAAGDDFNDLGMIEQADFGIAMAEAPDEVKQVANLIATDEGIIPALEEAICRVK